MTRIDEKNIITQDAGSKGIIPRWLSLSEACQYASMSARKMKRHIKAGEIHGLKKGKWFVDRNSIDAFFRDDNFQNLMVEKVLASFR